MRVFSVIVLGLLGGLAAQAAELSFQREADGLSLLWTDGQLEEATTVAGPWRDAGAAVAPHRVAFADREERYFRVRETDSAAPADQVIVNARVYTVNPDQPAAEAVAIREGKLIAVGDRAAMDAWIGDATQIVDAEGLLLLPGFQDPHLHAVEAGVNEANAILPQFGTATQYRRALRQAAVDSMVNGWVVGAGVNMEGLMEALESPLELIDEVIPDRPAVILDDLGHGAWVNTLGLRAAGFDRLEDDPAGGILVRDDATGDLLGVVLESASQTVLDLAFAPTDANLERAYQGLVAASQTLSANGITTVSDAGGYWPRGHHRVWERAEAAGTLTVRASNAFYIYPDRSLTSQLAALQALQRRDPNRLVRFDQAKIYVDGIVSQATSALYEPYESALGLGPDEQRGFLYFEPDRLFDFSAAFEKAGFQLHFHVTGDRGTGLALDAIAEARRRNGMTDRRHRLTHLFMVAERDRNRFRELDVFADFQLAPSSVDREHLREVRGFIGNRVNQYLPAGALFRAGAPMTLSSDWDADELSPFVKIETVLSLGDQGLPDVATAIRLMTLEAARLLHHETRTGSIVVGKWADLVLVDRDLFSVPISEIGNAEVVATLLAGRPVFDPEGLFEALP